MRRRDKILFSCGPHVLYLAMILVFVFLISRFRVLFCNLRYKYIHFLKKIPKLLPFKLKTKGKKQEYYQW